MSFHDWKTLSYTHLYETRKIQKGICSAAKCQGICLFIEHIVHDTPINNYKSASYFLYYLFTSYTIVHPFLT